MKTLVLFVFHVYNEIVESFFRNAVFYDENTDFLIIVNDTSLSFSIVPFPNVRVLFRDNNGYDFGAWSDGLLNDNLYKNYDYFIFLNSSMIGPFLPPYYKGKWTDVFINGLEGNIKLFGSTINNNDNNNHVQSSIFSMNKETFEYLVSCEIFSIQKYAKNRDEWIYGREIPMSRKIIEKGWNIGCLIPCYKGVDFTFSTKKPEEYNITFLKDILFEQYRNVVWNEYQLVFVKGNRGIQLNINKISNSGIFYGNPTIPTASTMWRQFINIENYKYKPINYLEVGVNYGENIIEVGKTYGLHTGSKLYCIDILEDFNIYDNFLRNIALSGNSEKIQLNRSDSYKILPTFQENFFDIIFLNNSSKNILLEEVMLAYRKLVPGGFLVLSSMHKNQEEFSLALHVIIESYQKYRNCMRFLGNEGEYIFFSKNS